MNREDGDAIVPLLESAVNVVETRFPSLVAKDLAYASK
jgi:hypothetical protein